MLEEQCRTAPPISRRRHTLADGEQLKTLLANVMPYHLIDYKRKTTITMRESLRPVNPLTRIDTTLKRLLKDIQQDSGELVPISHDTVRPPFTDAHHINTARTELYNKLKDRISDKIDRHLTTTDESEALPLPILQRIIDTAANMRITNPIFLGQSIVKVVKKHSKTRNLWKTWQTKYTKDGDLRPVHIIDLYQEAAQARGSAHQGPHRVAMETVISTPQQPGQTAKHYIDTYFKNLEDLATFVDENSSHETYPNNIIFSVINMTSEHIFKGAREGEYLRRHMSNDLYEKRSLPWGIWASSDTNLDVYIRKLKERYTKFELESDTKQKDIRSMMGTRRDTNQPRSRQHRHSTQKRKSGTSYQTNPNEICTSQYCEKRKYPPHKVGELDGCGRNCKLHLKGMQCPTKRDDKGGRHF